MEVHLRGLMAVIAFIAIGFCIVFTMWFGVLILSGHVVLT